MLIDEFVSIYVLLMPLASAFGSLLLARKRRSIDSGQEPSAKSQ
jgi:hypothetical protein